MTINDLIYLENPWYRDRGFIPKEHNLPKREVFSLFIEDVIHSKYIISLTGLRRVGKSTLLKQVIASLLVKSEPPKRIFYFSFDQPTISKQPEVLENIIIYYLESILHEKIHRVEKKVYIFLDEIQLVPFWQDILKRFYDINQNLKFIVSGSASLFVKEEAKESLAGRLLEFYLPPLSFSEYTMMSGNADFIDFLDYGQFPEMLEMKDNTKKIEYLKEGIIGKVLEIDIVKIHGIRKAVDFERLFWSLLPNTGQIIQSRKLMLDLSFKKATLFKYLSILEKSLLINKVLNISGSFRSEKRLLRKLYPGSTNFLTLIPSPVNIGFKVETYVNNLLTKTGKAVYLLHLRGKEIDFVLPEVHIAIEVKYQEHVHPLDYRFLEKYIGENNYKGIIVTKTYKASLPEKHIQFIPLEEFEKQLSQLISF